MSARCVYCGADEPARIIFQGARPRAYLACARCDAEDTTPRLSYPIIGTMIEFVGERMPSEYGGAEYVRAAWAGVVFADAVGVPNLRRIESIAL